MYAPSCDAAAAIEQSEWSHYLDPLRALSKLPEDNSEEQMRTLNDETLMPRNTAGYSVLQLIIKDPSLKANGVARTLHLQDQCVSNIFSFYGLKYIAARKTFSKIDGVNPDQKPTKRKKALRIHTLNRGRINDLLRHETVSLSSILQDPTNSSKDCTPHGFFAASLSNRADIESSINEQDAVVSTTQDPSGLLSDVPWSPPAFQLHEHKNDKQNYRPCFFPPIPTGTTTDSFQNTEQMTENNGLSILDIQVPTASSLMHF
jgi:hypothetical protein